MVDVHAHVVPPSLLAELSATSAGIHGFSAERIDKGWVVTVPGCGPTRPAGARMTELGPRRVWMSRTGITEQVLSPWMEVLSGDLAPNAARDWARRLNDAMAATAAALGGGTRALATVATCDGESAAAGLEEVRSRPEMAGVLLTTSPGRGVTLHDPEFDGFWATAEREGIPIVLHPPTCGPSTALPALGGMGDVHGRLLDTTLAVTALILHGLLDRYPLLRLVLVHGGGFLPYQAARIDGGYRTRDAFAGELERGLPSAYLPHLYYDTAALSPPAIAFLTRLAGTGRVLLGSDYPFALSDPDPARTVLSAGLPPEKTMAVLRRQRRHRLPDPRLNPRRSDEAGPVRLPRAPRAGRGAGHAARVRRRGEGAGRRPEPDADAELPAGPDRAPGRHQPDDAASTETACRRGHGRDPGAGAAAARGALERIGQALPVLTEALGQVAHPQIRNRGTVCGSLAHADPAAELPSVMSVLDATFTVVSARGTPQVPVADFFQFHLTTAMEPDELLLRVRIELPPAGTYSAFCEFATRRGDFALAGVAAVVAFDAAGVVTSCRVAAAGVAPTPHRLRPVEEWSLGSAAGRRRAARGGAPRRRRRRPDG